MTASGNLPPWPGADACYARAYRIMKAMARNGHAIITEKRVALKRGGSMYMRICVPSDELRAFAQALNSGDEERIREKLRRYRHYDPDNANLEIVQ